MALASALASALSDAHATMAHAKVHEDYAAADPFSSPVPPSKQNAPPATVFKPTSVTPPSPPRTPPSPDKREPASTVAARRALRAAVERVERRCARVEAVVASRLDALDARCNEMKSMMVKLVENQPTKTCLDAVKAAREAAARSEAAARQAQKHAQESPSPKVERKKSLSDRLAALSPLKKQPVVEEDSLVAAYASYQNQEPPSISKVPNDFATIQAAIDAAEDDGLVIIQPGLYREALVVARPIKLEAAECTSDDEGIGAPLTTVTVEAPAPGSRALLVTAAGSCAARGIAWRCSTEVSDLARPCAAVGVKGGRLSLESCAVGSASALSGVNAQRGATLSLLRVTGANCRHTGVLLSGAGTTATLERCDLSENGEDPCGNLREPPRHRTAAVTVGSPRHRAGAITPEIRFPRRRARPRDPGRGARRGRAAAALRAQRALRRLRVGPRVFIKAEEGGPVAESEMWGVGPVGRVLRRVRCDVLEKWGTWCGVIRGQVECGVAAVRLRGPRRSFGVLQRRRVFVLGRAGLLLRARGRGLAAPRGGAIIHILTQSFYRKGRARCSRRRTSPRAWPAT
jgi:hypothetical protein